MGKWCNRYVQRHIFYLRKVQEPDCCIGYANNQPETHRSIYVTCRITLKIATDGLYSHEGSGND